MSSAKSDVVAWDWAEKVALRVAGNEPFADSYLADSLEADLHEATARAEVLVFEATGLSSDAGAARARVTDRAGWVHANVASFRRLLTPLTDKLAARVKSKPVATVGRNVAGTELGALLGWMSTRVLGQYDILLAKDDKPEEQDIVYYVGPNVLALEKRFGFPPQEFRLWLALHEVTHRMQFTGVPWMSDYFQSLVSDIIDRTEPDTKKFVDAIKRTTKQVRAGEDPLGEVGLMAMLATPEQLETIKRMTGLMSLLEGHGDVVMGRAAEGLIPNAERFHRVLHDRRKQSTGTAKFMQKVLGMEAKLRQYEQGEKFIEAVEAEGGRTLFDTVWRAPEFLPNASEIAEPQSWIDRVQGAAPLPA